MPRIKRLTHTYHCTARLMCVARGSGTSQIGRSADKQLKPAEIPYKNKQKAQKAQKTHKARGRMSSVCVLHCANFWRSCTNTRLWNIILPHCCIKWCQQQPSSWAPATNSSSSLRQSSPDQIEFNCIAAARWLLINFCCLLLASAAASAAAAQSAPQKGQNQTS